VSPESEPKHIRDWVDWECGIAAAAAIETTKDFWLLESIAETGSFSAVIPHDDDCLSYAGHRWF
jgi:hypothetical protein